VNELEPSVINWKPMEEKPESGEVVLVLNRTVYGDVWWAVSLPMVWTGKLWRHFQKGKSIFKFDPIGWAPLPYIGETERVNTL